jgi:hypothetical protein
MTSGDDWRNVLEQSSSAGEQSVNSAPAPAPVDVPTAVEMARQMALPAGSPTPVMEPAQAMRIWIAPWVDVNQDLHWPEYVFTEVTPRRWTWGEKPIRSSTMAAPVLMRGNSRDTIFPPASSSSNDSANVYEELQRRGEKNPVPGVNDALNAY